MTTTIYTETHTLSIYVSIIDWLYRRGHVFKFEAAVFTINEMLNDNAMCKLYMS